MQSTLITTPLDNLKVYLIERLPHIHIPIIRRFIHILPRLSHLRFIHPPPTPHPPQMI
jgi:hypothetical protein